MTGDRCSVLLLFSFILNIFYFDIIARDSSQPTIRLSV